MTTSTSGTDTIAITVTNVAPTIAVSGAATTNEGAVYSLTLGAVTDPGVDTVTSYIVHWGDGTDTYATNGVKTHTYPDGPNSYTIVVDLVDEDGTFANAGSKAVSVLNVAPTVAFTGGPTAVTEHASTQQTFTYSITDPGQDSQTVVVSCGAGGALVSGSASNTATGGSFKCVFDDGPATEVVSATATDSDVATGNTATRSVAVSNVAPTITSLTSNPTAAVIGQTIVITASAVDPSGADTTAGFQWHFDTGSGTFGPYGSANSLIKTITTCGPVVIRAQARDKNGGESAIATLTVQTFDGKFLSPLKEGVSNVVQKGRTLPVQISFGCGGSFISGLHPEIQLLDGDFVANAGIEDPGDNVVTESVSGADTGNVMREQASKYMYNLSIPTAGMTGGKPLTVRVRPYGPNTQPTMYILLEIKK